MKTYNKALKQLISHAKVVAEHYRTGQVPPAEDRDALVHVVAYFNTQAAGIDTEMLVSVLAAELEEMHRELQVLRALEAGGVDGWVGYDASLEMLEE